ncbi:MAG: hypothetical protein ACPG21_09625 [Crocinitomicaceae bacterium]
MIKPLLYVVFLVLALSSCRKKFQVEGDAYSFKMKISKNDSIIFQNASDSVAVILNENKITVYILYAGLGYESPEYGFLDGLFSLSDDKIFKKHQVEPSACQFRLTDHHLESLDGTYLKLKRGKKDKILGYFEGDFLDYTDAELTGDTLFVVGRFDEAVILDY